MGFFVARRNLYESKSASDVTSETYWIGDAITISLFLRGSTSTTSVQFSEADGRDSVIAETEWSTITTVLDPDPDIVHFDPGSRWMRLLRTSNLSNAVLNLQNRVR